MGMETVGFLGLAGAAIAQGEQQKKIARQSLIAQTRAQDSAAASAAAAARRSAMEQRALNKKKPNVTSLLADEQQRALTGPSAAMLTGNLGVRPSMLKLGGVSPLGT